MKFTSKWERVRLLLRYRTGNLGNADTPRITATMFVFGSNSLGTREFQLSYHNAQIVNENYWSFSQVSNIFTLSERHYIWYLLTTKMRDRALYLCFKTAMFSLCCCFATGDNKILTFFGSTSLKTTQ